MLSRPNDIPGRLALGLVFAASIAALAPSIAAAQAGEGAIRLGGDVDVLGISHLPDVGTEFGLGVSGFALGTSVAYQLTDSILIGGRARFGFDIDAPAIGDEEVTGNIGLLPFFEYMIPDPSAAPFFGGQLGFDIFFPDGGDAQALIVAGAFGGIHLFLTDSFSVSPQGQLNFIYLGAIERAGFEFRGLLTFNGWIGGGGPSVTITAPTTTPAVGY